MRRHPVPFSSRLVMILLPVLVVLAFSDFGWNKELWNTTRFYSVLQIVPDTKLHLLQIVSPYVATEKGDVFYPLDFNQWAAMESIRRSLERVPTNLVKVDFVCAVSSAERWILVQAGLPCHRFLVLSRSTRTEYPDIEPHFDLPFISDMIDRIAHPHHNTSFHIMIMNSDIGVSKDFYSRIIPVLRNHDAFSINRVTIPMDELYETTNATTLLENEVDRLISRGKRHPGYDLFCISDTILERVSFGDFFLGRPPWGANIHIMLQIMAERYINIRSSPFGTFHLGNDMSRWKKASASSSLAGDKHSRILQSFCPSKNARLLDDLAIKNEVNCGIWFLGGNSTIIGSRQTKSKAFLPGFVRPGFELTFWNAYEKYLKFDSMGLPHDRNYETPKQKKLADRSYARNKKRSTSDDPLQQLNSWNDHRYLHTRIHSSLPSSI